MTTVDSMRSAVRKPSGAAWLAAAAALVAMALGLIGLGSKSLWYDETYTAWAIRGSWSRLWSLIQDHESPHAFYYTVVKSWTDLAGRSELALRLPSVVAAGVSIVVVYLLGKRVFGASAGAAAAAALALNPFVVIWSQQARSYSFALLAASLSTLALVHALEQPSAGRWALYAAVAGATLFVHLFAGLVLPAHALAVILRRPRVSLLAPLVAFALVGALALRLAELVASRPDVLTAWIQQPGAGDVVKGFLLVAGFSPVPILVSALAARAARRRGVPSWVVALLAVWAVGPFVVTVAVSFVEPVYAPRYLIVAVPPFALLTGYWLATAARRRALAVAGVLAGWALVVLGLWYAAPPLENWRGATSVARASVGPGEELLFAPSPAATGVEYYLGEGAAATRPATETVWLVVWGSSPREREQAGQAAVGDLGYARAERRTIDGWLDVERWTQR